MKIKIFIETDKIGSRCEEEVEILDWESMNEDQREQVCKEIAFNFINWGFTEA